MIYFDQELRAGLDPAHNLSSWKETVKRKKMVGVAVQENIKISINSKKPPNANPA